MSSREAHSGRGHSPPGAGHRRALAVVLGISGTILAVEVIAGLAAAAVIALTGWDRADAVTSLLIGALILPRLLDQLQQCLAGHFDVEHSTVQFEPASHAAHEHPAHA